MTPSALQLSLVERGELEADQLRSLLAGVEGRALPVSTGRILDALREVWRLSLDWIGPFGPGARGARPAASGRLDGGAVSRGRSRLCRR